MSADTLTELEHEPTAANPVAPAMARSWLLVTGARPEGFTDAAASGADALVLDLEDAVAVSAKASARSAVVDWLTSGNRAWVRINDATTPHWRDDLEALRDVDALEGVMLAKAESVAQVAATADRLRQGTPIVALVESAVGLEEASAIARHPSTFRLAFGVGDFRRDTGMGASEIALAYPRSRLVVASRAAGLPGPIDGPSLSTDPETVRDQSMHAASLGMTGRLCLHGVQAPTVNGALSPSGDDVAWAAGVLAEFEAGGRVIRDGSDLPRIARARAITADAAAFAYPA
ncbi:HpcH/HpaI aldolase/citrate lyase family protein [Agromyces allii]|uniref:CoA ester lyase n=1 Tax=Agromyces allii TaxID=393607 RepID=A0ABN2QYS6_9MICO|nr:aldolase/citrate lyase family protein [Agromyces allii]